MTNKKILLISKDSFLFDSLRDNIGLPNLEFILIKSQAELTSWLKNPQKIDILINNIDNANLPQEAGYFAKYVFSFFESKIRNEILIKKPISLKTLIFELRQCISNKRLFCLIDDVIYDEIHSEIIDKDKVVHKLSDKENHVIKLLLLAEDYCLSDEFLLENVWKYSLETDTETVKTHMHKLKSMLPDGFLQFAHNGYKLNVAKIF